MKQDNTMGRPWRRKGNSELQDGPDYVFSELKARELSDLERCRFVWEQEQDPLAVCVAITKCQLPDWLTDALLVLAADSSDFPPLGKRLWASRTRDSVDALRAWNVAAARAHPDPEARMTLEVSYAVADIRARSTHPDIPRVGPMTVRKGYRRVQTMLKRLPGKYHRAPKGFRDRLWKARGSVVVLIEACFKRQQAAEGKRGSNVT